MNTPWHDFDILTRARRYRIFVQAVRAGRAIQHWRGGWNRG